jgi:hypothetical protein
VGEKPDGEFCYSPPSLPYLERSLVPFVWIVATRDPPPAVVLPRGRAAGRQNRDARRNLERLAVKKIYP